ncbi:amidohydrolase [Virgibacillus sediminis]|uniref:Amidohydrolase n=1 Tax=Virgibacillus sediminis TaxID=202260 RepID=A0ABV7A505_9BACI
MSTSGAYIFYNGKIFTANSKTPNATAMVVKDGRIAWVGEKDELEDITGEWIDLNGRRVLPGFIDAHLHPLFLADTSKQFASTLPSVRSISDLIGKIRKQRELQGGDKWVESWGYDEGKLAEGRAPNRYDLDKGAQDVPVVMTRTCGHIISVNSIALKLAGIDKNTKDPAGGKIDRDENGEPTGILRESARELVLSLKSTKTLDENAASVAELSPELLAHGITGITELLAHNKPVDYLDIYKEASQKGLNQRTVVYYAWEDFKKLEDLDSKLNREEQVHIGGIKLFADGSISGQTAWIDEPYIGGKKENYGIPTTSKEELLAAAEAAKRYDIQLIVHAMGEQAINLILDTFQDQEGWINDGPSIRIEHATLPTKQALERAASAGIAFVPQPVFIFAEIESYVNNLGIARTKRSYPVKSMLEAGIKVALSSDAPATAWADPVNPFVGIQSAVTRKAYNGEETGQDEQIDVETAITLYTRSAQEITRIPDVGQLAPGYHADFIVLDQDILEMDADKIADVQVIETYMGGVSAFIKKRVL